MWWFLGQLLVARFLLGSMNRGEPSLPDLFVASESSLWDGKVVLWQNLRDSARLGARLPDINFDRLIERARSQRAESSRFMRRPRRRRCGWTVMRLPATAAIA